VTRDRSEQESRGVCHFTSNAPADGETGNSIADTITKELHSFSGAIEVGDVPHCGVILRLRTASRNDPGTRNPHVAATSVALLAG